MRCPPNSDKVSKASFKTGYLSLRNESEQIRDEHQRERALDDELLAAISKKNRDALSKLYDRHSSILYAMAVRILNDTNEAEDVLQETVMIIWEKAGTYHPNNGTPFAWIVTVLRNKALERLRSSQRRSQLAKKMELTKAEAVAPPPLEVGFDEQRTRVHSALGELPQDQREAIELAFFDGKSQQEISQKLNQPLGTIKARIRRGLMKLRACLGVQK